MSAAAPGARRTAPATSTPRRWCERRFPVSSGAPSTPTVVGSFKVYLKTFGTNAKGMVHSSFFFGGYALHGYPEVPVFPASHGCLRGPIPDALSS